MIDPSLPDRQEEVRQEPPVRRPRRGGDDLFRGLRLPRLHDRSARGNRLGNQQLRLRLSGGQGVRARAGGDVAGQRLRGGNLRGWHALRRAREDRRRDLRGCDLLRLRGYRRRGPFHRSGGLRRFRDDRRLHRFRGGHRLFRFRRRNLLREVLFRRKKEGVPREDPVHIRDRCIDLLNRVEELPPLRGRNAPGGQDLQKGVPPLHRVIDRLAVGDRLRFCAGGNEKFLARRDPRRIGDLRVGTPEFLEALRIPVRGEGLVPLEDLPDRVPLLHGVHLEETLFPARRIGIDLLLEEDPGGILPILGRRRPGQQRGQKNRDGKKTRRDQYFSPVNVFDARVHADGFVHLWAFPRLVEDPVVDRPRPPPDGQGERRSPERRAPVEPLAQQPPGAELPVDPKHIFLSFQVLEPRALIEDRAVVPQRLEKVELVPQPVEEGVPALHHLRHHPQAPAHLPRRQAGLHRPEFLRHVSPRGPEVRLVTVFVQVDLEPLPLGIIDDDEGDLPSARTPRSTRRESTQRPCPRDPSVRRSGKTASHPGR